MINANNYYPKQYNITIIINVVVCYCCLLLLLLLLLLQDAQVDQLKHPKHFPDPVIIYSLRELTIVWHLYGGRDFTIPLSPPSSCSPTTMKKHKAAAATATSQDGEHVAYHNRGGVRNVWKRKGGVGRDHDVLMEIELNKVRNVY